MVSIEIQDHDNLNCELKNNKSFQMFFRTEFLLRELSVPAYTQSGMTLLSTNSALVNIISTGKRRFQIPTVQKRKSKTVPFLVTKKKRRAQKIL